MLVIQTRKALPAYYVNSIPTDRSHTYTWATYITEISTLTEKHTHFMTPFLRVAFFFTPSISHCTLLNKKEKKISGCERNDDLGCLFLAGAVTEIMV